MRDDSRVTWLQYLIYLLIVMLTLVTSWNSHNISQIPREYVQLERYSSDQRRTEGTLNRVESKLDRMIEKGLK